MTNNQKIAPFLWFDHQAEAAANFYTSVFNNSSIGTITRNNGEVLVVPFTLDGQSFSAMNGGPKFKFNPSISFFVVCETEAETDLVWEKLLEGGVALMPLAKYDWSDKYGWVQDRYGLTWQISLGSIAELGQKFTPALLFTGKQQGKAEEALRFYTSLFEDSSVVRVHLYGPGEAGAEGNLKYGQFKLGQQAFIAMDHPLEENFAFNEAISLVINCSTQQEVDFFWEKLLAEGGEESMCGWLKDKFGLSWQIIPEALPRLLSDPDPVKAQRVMAAMLQMRKIDLEKLIQARENTSTEIRVEATVKVPVQRVWQLWTEPEHIMQWNNASDDWHTPKAFNDLRVGGKFVSTMAAKDGSFSFDFGGTYDVVLENQRIAYTLEDNRKVSVEFRSEGNQTQITEVFEAETMNSPELQRAGWQAILDNFKKYAEANG